MTTLTFEEVTQQHLHEIRKIYNYYVLNTTISFHTEELDINQIKSSVMNKDTRYKSYVIFENNEIMGYVLITQYKSKQAYDTCGEVTIYLKPNCLGQGIGKQALSFIEEVAKEQGFHTLIATICMENTRSKSLFDRNGYEQCALFKEIGYKFDRRLDIGSFQKIL
ncbi:GNAT family N-acetyltransferase [Paenibacillus peoriae]|uniref:GNAT family N-acetyltransferase n=1 Tax=Paenibacillus peoriae TaxID=59893 RepID=UPI00026C6180|nr:GNAT family N-acetyltransferase [Paenibacillus peoriae]MEC0183138.1 GNAT family N-acetyltransferase [Paenibacillus peoriae]